jgi:uncharacterized protein
VPSIRWRRLDLPGTDRATLAPTETGHFLLGHARFEDARGPVDLHYSIVAGSDWRTLQARVDGLDPDGLRSLQIAVAPDGSWRINGRQVPEVQGCVDIDLAFTPATNLLSIRRLALAPGQSGEVLAAWLAYPQDLLRPLRQVYEHQADGRYRYRCPELGFETVLEVDATGFVQSYPPLWAPEDGSDRAGPGVGP